jgi:hypothetical protein
MHDTNIKLLMPQQAKSIIQYRNTKLKLLKTNAAVWFKKMCRNKRTTYLVCISSNSHGSKKLPDDGRLLPKCVGACILNKEVI